MVTEGGAPTFERAVLDNWRLIGEMMADSVERRLTPRLETIEGQLSGVEGRLSGVEGRLSGVEGRLSGVEGRLSVVEQGQAELKEQVGDLQGQVGDLQGQVGDLQGQVGRLENSTRRGFQNVEGNLEQIRTLFSNREWKGEPQAQAPRTRTGG